MYLIFLIFPLYLEFFSLIFASCSYFDFLGFFFFFFYFFNSRINFFYSVRWQNYIYPFLFNRLKFKQIIFQVPFFNHTWKPIFKRTSYYGLFKSKNN